MTCGSERSGSASSGVCRAESAAQTARMMTAPNTSHLWRTDSSMMRSTMPLLPMTGVRLCRGLLRLSRVSCRSAMAVRSGTAGRAEPALRIQQEHAGGDDPLTFLEARSDLDPIRQLHAKRHGTRLETIACRHENVLLPPGIHDRIAWNG